MINSTLDIIEWVLLAAFLLSAFNTRTISLLMVANIGLGMILYKWFLTVPPVAGGAVTTLINMVTIILILRFGEDSIHKAIQPAILLAFIGVDAMLLSGLIYEAFEGVLLVLYGVMFLTILKGAGRGARYCIQPNTKYHIKTNDGHHSGRHSS